MSNVKLNVRVEPYKAKESDDGVIFEGNKVIGEVKCGDKILYMTESIPDDSIESVCTAKELVGLAIELWAVKNTDFMPTADALPT